ncbi:hypothetical protein NL500_29945, partial [Klebsiella pneumoniae]|nr:hypothetical protein [Klebsiella pneumoniae]
MKRLTLKQRVEIVKILIDLLKLQFIESIILRNGPINWPLRSCDLTPLDYFLCSYGKSLVYADKPKTAEVLKM